MAVLCSQAIADFFVEEYHTALEKDTANLHKFYHESSILSWPGNNGDSVTPVTTLNAINEKILSSDFKTFKIESKTMKAQSSVEGAIFVSVTGILVKDNMKRNYTQNFFLAKQEKGFYISNDILHIFDVIESPTIPNVVNHNNDNVSVSENISTNTNAMVQNGNVEENIDAYVGNVTEAKVVTSTASATTSAKIVTSTEAIIANAFIEQYHCILDKSTENLHKFYKESSILSWPGNDGGSATHVTTLSAIKEKIMSSDFKTFKIESKTVKAQWSVEGAVFVSVTGILVKDNVKRNYTQNFFLAKQETGFYVFNDILHIFDVIESQTIPVVNDVERNEQVVSNVDNDNVSVSENISTNTNATVQNENVEQNIGVSISADWIIADW